ncbi:MAG: hypothetical protein KDA57_22815 [Planctomycetales bacterium]|nr:hypothetical protein [Planctomycetales bacterium]
MPDSHDYLTFPERAVARYATFVPSDELRVGCTYFRVTYLDDELRIPQLLPVTYLGRDLEAETPGLYFQDSGSYLAGERYLEGDAPGSFPPYSSLSSAIGSPGGWLEVIESAECSGVAEFEAALDVLLLCSLTRDDE